MAAFPEEIDIHRTSHFLFETGSLMVFGFGLLFVISTALTAIRSAVIDSLSLVGSVAAVVSGSLTLLGVGLLYLSVQISPP